MVEKYRITIPELTGFRKKRRLYVYLPEDYHEDVERRYPVLYMFDGQNVFFDEDSTFGKSWGLKDYLDFTEAKLIVVAVECNNDSHNGRIKEYAPFSFNDEELGWITGRGRKTMDWLINELKPQIDNDYRTLPLRETTFIAGSSMGGLMTLYAISAYNDYFSRGAALSPTLEANPRRILNMLKNAPIRSDTVLYMDFGEQELDQREEMRGVFARACSILINKGVRLSARVVPEGDHSEASWERQNDFYIGTLMYGL